MEENGQGSVSEPQTIEQRIQAKLVADPAFQAMYGEPAAPEPKTAPEAPRAEAEPQTETPRAEAPEPDTPEQEEIEIADLNGLAEHLGVDPADLYNLAVPYTKDGERHEFTLGDIKDKYQQFEEANTLREQAQRQLDTYREAETRYVNMIQETTQQTAAYLQHVERVALAPFQNVDWNNLRVTNPGEFINKQQQLQQTQAQLAQVRQAAAQHVQNQRAGYEEQQKTMRAERLAREQQALLKAIPEWRDPKVADAERLQLSEFMLELGYSNEEINAVDDHRALLVVRDAMRYRKAKDSGDAAVKKVVKLAKKITKPGSRPATGEQASTQAANLARSHRANPKDMSLAAARIALKLGRK